MSLNNVKHNPRMKSNLGIIITRCFINRYSSIITRPFEKQFSYLKGKKYRKNENSYSTLKTIFTTKVKLHRFLV